MQIFDAVSAQISAMGLPLFAISATRAEWPDAPLLLFLHWHGFRRATPLQLAGVPMPARAVPSSALQFDGPGASSTAAEEALLEAAWRLGAWQLERQQRRASDLSVVMVSRGDRHANQAKVDKYKLTFPVALQRQWEISRDYGMFGTPIAYLIDEGGMIAADVAVGVEPILGLLSSAIARASRKEVVPMS